MAWWHKMDHVWLTKVSQSKPAWNKGLRCMWKKNWSNLVPCLAYCFKHWGEKLWLCCQITILLPVTLTAMMPDFKITCRRRSISVCLPTINILAWPINMHELQSPFLWCMTSLTTQVWTSQFLFSLCTSSSQPFSHFLVTFFFHIFFSHFFFHTSYICTTQTGFESSLENSFSWFLPAGAAHKACGTGWP